MRWHEHLVRAGAIAAALGVIASAPGGAYAASEGDVRAVTAEIICYCGCSHQTVAECTCDTAEAIRARVADQLDSGLSPRQVIDAWVAERGEQILAVPTRRGFNLVGWAMPFVAVLSALLAVSVLMLRRERRLPRGGAAEPPGGPSEEERAYLKRVEREARSLDG